MQEFRITRPEFYTGNCQGRTDVSARQGHYIKAEVPTDAVKEIAKFFEDLVFDVEVWDGPCEPRNKAVSMTRWGFVINPDDSTPMLRWGFELATANFGTQN